jgi:hypothetical protein
MPSPEPIDVTHYTYKNEYHYSPKHLWQSYGIAILLTTIAIMIGLLSLRSNGVSHSTSFSAIMSTTRNLKLDELVWDEGRNIGFEPLSETMMETKLRFGKLLDGTGSSKGKFSHVGFGYENQLQSLKRGEMLQN